MASLDMASFDAALKQLYSEEKIFKMVYEDAPLFAMLPKMEKFVGKNMVIDTIYANPQGRSATFATAQANQSNVKVVGFTITREQDYAVASLDNEVMEASASDAGALLEAASTQIDGALDQLKRSLVIALYRSGSGSIGQANASVTGTSLQLKNINDVVNFEVDQILVFSTADGGGSVKSGSVSVTAVNRDSGLLTTSAMSAIDGGTGVAANDYIFIIGDYDQKIKGLQAWLPNSAPSNTPFFGVDRSKDVTRLGGIRIDGTNLPIEEALTKAITRLSREGGKPTHCFLNHAKWEELVNSLGSKVQYVNEQVKAGEAYISFQGVMLHGPKGAVKIIPDANCPSDRAFLLQMDTWKLYSLGKVPRIIDSDGLRLLRQATADGVEFRCVYYAQLACKAPGRNATVAL
jgi:hypothetical protein